MNLIQYSKNRYVNSDKITCLRKDPSHGENHIYFRCEDGVSELVSPDFVDIFLNHLQAINKNISNVETLIEN